MRQQTGKNLRRIGLTIPDNLYRWLKIQAAKTDVSVSLYIAKMIEKEKNFLEFNEKSAKKT